MTIINFGIRHHIFLHSEKAFLSFPPPPPARHCHSGFAGTSTLSIWLSVDPMSDKYPGVSPYVYCGNNPVRLVDPDGRIIGEVDEKSQNKINALTDKNSADYSRAFTRQFHRLERSKEVYNFYEATENEITTSTQGKVTKNANGGINIIHSSVPSARTSLEGGFSREYATLFEETFHAADHDRGRLD